MKNISLLLILILLGNMNIFAQKMLRADGKKIVDGTGKEIILRGIGLGGWLVPEGYMFNMNGFANSPTEIKNKVIELVGKENAEAFFKEFRKNFVTKKDIDSLASWGFNSVRLPMHYELMTPRDEPFVYIEEGFDIINNLLAWCKAADIYLILDLHAAPGGQSDEPISDYDPNFPSLWESEENKLRTIDLWREIASRYKDEEYIAGYDLLNEPKWYLPPDNKPLRDLYVQITSAIREVDTNHIVFAEGNWFSTDFTGLTPTWDNNMAYSFHKYWSEVTKGSIQSYLTLRDQHNVPLWMSESGENSNAWFSDFVELLEENSIGWAWWTHKKFESISAPSSVYIAPQFQQLLDYWSGQGSKPDEDYSMSALMLQAENLQIEKSKIKYDMLDALLRMPFENSRRAFNQNTLPGRIYATEYDYGKQGISYFDVTYQNIGGSTYNTGWTYRNDGVDIERCTDQITNGYNVGWIESGEWLKFTLDVEESGIYDIKLRITANNSDGKIQMLVDSEDLASLIDVPSTGGWQNWQTLIVPDVEIKKGQRELMVRFFFGGFNINYMEFDLITVGVEDNDESDVISEYKLEQNYPNPFNPVTTIEYSVPTNSKNLNSNIVLKIYDPLGNEIETLVNEEQSSGFYKVNFDGTDLASGIYFYSLSAGEFKSTKKMLLLK